MLNNKKPAKPAPKALDYYAIEDVEYFTDKLNNALKLGHTPDRCLICKKDQNPKNCTKPMLNLRMSKISFEWHLNSFSNSDGQSLSCELIDGMWNKYLEIVKSLRWTSKKANRPYPTITVEYVRINENAERLRASTWRKTCK
jgi:hypothetical protein